ncbi:rhomboid-related protein 3-like isoform X2 [Diorhabda carinulata]|uniref:rhomboid-related protein 3-like isoform X2 n=1 Tax=Diorhabda carinulata TaxID=1163345 RepID=UPI0025A2AD17|nr:rhomboid-related protein 3-like isoform X2 [Diorhabda carinulata]
MLCKNPVVVTVKTMEVPKGNEDENIQLRNPILNNSEVCEYFKSIFTRCDTDKDGYVSVSELKKFLETQEEVVISEDVLDILYEKFDRNKDRQLDFEEFLDMINNNTFKETFYSVANRFFKFVVVPKGCRNRMRIQRTITMTGEYENNLKFGTNLMGMAIISLLQLIFFYANAAYKKTPKDWGPVAEALCFDPCKKREVYRYFTYALLHADLTHLLGNVIIQISVGIVLEMMHSWRVAVIYIAGAIGGSMTHSVLDRKALLVGGSGGVFSFFSAHIAEVIMNWREMSHPSVRLLLFGIVVVVEVVINVITNPTDSTSHVCHAGGAIVGLLLGVNILRNLQITEKENIIWYICLLIQIVLAMIFIILDFKLPIEIDCFNFNSTISSQQVFNRTLIEPEYN